jgi:hypothetical protein
MLDQIYKNYTLIKDSIKITKRSVFKNYNDLYQKTSIANERIDSVTSSLDTAQDDLDDLMILALYSYFEKSLREFVIQKFSTYNSTLDSQIISKMQALSKREIDRWKMTALIDLFNPVLDPRKLGNIKQINDYRNWIAHGKKSDNLPPATIDPKSAFDLLNWFLIELEKL